MENVYSSELVDLGDAVVETKGSATVGIAEPLSGFRHMGGFSSED